MQEGVATVTLKLGYIVNDLRGETDRVLAALADRLLATDLRLAGVVQTNSECVDGGRCDMDLRVLPDGPVIRISQSLGQGSRGCRLDPAALEQAVGLVLTSLANDPDLLIINKFGKHEADGRGFRPLIAEALTRGIPVLVGVNALNEARFTEFSGGEAQRLSCDVASLSDWLALNNGTPALEA